MLAAYNYNTNTVLPGSPQNHPLLKQAIVIRGNPLISEKAKSLTARLMTYMFEGVLSDGVLATRVDTHTLTHNCSFIQQELVAKIKWINETFTRNIHKNPRTMKQSQYSAVTVSIFGYAVGFLNKSRGSRSFRILRFGSRF